MATDYTTKNYDIEKKASAHVTSVLPVGEVEVVADHSLGEDEATLVALGYKQEFRREFSMFTSFGVSFSVLGLLPSIATTLWYGMGYAGTAGMVWGWLIAMVGIQCVAMSMAELASSMPTSGGLYYAAAILAPEGWGPLASWITGWSNWIGQVTGAPSVDYGCAAMILAAASVYNPSYVPTNYQTFLLTVLLLLVHGAISSLPTRHIAIFNSVSTWLNMGFLIIVLVIIPSATTNRDPRFNPSSEVWGTISNETEWPNGIAILMSFISVIWTMSGYDAPFHLSEECSNAAIASPRAIVLTAETGGLLGWFLMLVIAYTVRDIPAVIGSELGQPFVAYCLQVLPQKTAMAVVAMTIVCSFFMGQGCMVAASRVTYAYGRDGVFPLSWIPGTVNKYTQTPVNAVWMNTSIGILLLLLIYGGSLAISAIFSIGAIGAYVAFTLPVALRTFVVGNRFRPGPWNLGRWSRLSGTVATAFTLLMMPVLCFPTVRGADLNAQTMNWTVVVWGGPMFLAMVWWVVDAREWFKGPKINVEHQMLARPADDAAQAPSRSSSESSPAKGA
ncbi:amino acid permease [Stereum hirsutum FP-91666 SS1]|uniref:Amino acid permease n=1 Tax=Stereum hirsutum (strain FP-91666) TaxID=721885 RepID=R7RX15_STEHR|nr:amino acid permease [Stereum hirsutum FP-91666 SS1]EIM79395.1 amino acid permease [Stereum hirsutum FP-91666 SS1]